jgi:outer membrane protein assembly factor BamB
VKIDPAVKCGWQGRCGHGYGSPPTVIPGIVLSAASDGHLRAFDVASGQKVWDFDTAGQTYRTVNGVENQRGGPIESYGPTIAGGRMYVISGYNGAGGGGWSNNVLLAFSKDGK